MLFTLSLVNLFLNDCGALGGEPLVCRWETGAIVLDGMRPVAQEASWPLKAAQAAEAQFGVSIGCPFVRGG